VNFSVAQFVVLSGLSMWQHWCACWNAVSEATDGEIANGLQLLLRLFVRPIRPPCKQLTTKKNFFLLNQKTFFPDNTESEAGEMKMWHHRF
jgi:hypothetical protein